MQAQVLLPDSRTLSCDSVTYDAGTILIVVSGIASSAVCPVCGQSTDRIHSRYLRRLADLPWQGLRVEIQWRSRRFYCTNTQCGRRIFTERLPEVAAPRARRTNRLSVILRAVALACGGEEGSRLAERLGVSTSADTLLRETRRSPTMPCADVRVLGVDDWALCKGQRYGTILVDLERHRVVDLLPERSSESFATWLRDHPEVKIVSRDRGDYYIKGADAGAPKAQQVTDRWHLTHNLYEALLRLVERFPRELKALAHHATPAATEDPEPIEVMNPVPAQAICEKQTKLAAQKCKRRDRRLERYQQVVELRQQKISQREIARRLEMHRSTVRQWLQIGCFPERAGRRSRSVVSRWTDQLRQRWNEGCHNAVELTAELRLQGFKGSYDVVRRLVSQWRTKGVAAEQITKPPVSSPRSMAWLLFEPPSDQEPRQQELAHAFCEACPVVDRTVQMVQTFRALIRQRNADGLEPWLNLAAAADTPVELQRFATGLKADLAAVTAALSSPWSNGQTEGQVNRLKFIKRQMYGRANFDLLRKRVLAGSGR